MIGGASGIVDVGFASLRWLVSICPDALRFSGLRFSHYARASGACLRTAVPSITGCNKITPYEQPDKGLNHARRPIFAPAPTVVGGWYDGGRYGGEQFERDGGRCRSDNHQHAISHDIAELQAFVVDFFSHNFLLHPLFNEGCKRIIQEIDF